MDNRVYYGEYSLKHWVDLILKRNIVLPEYQRYFVWEEKHVGKLIETLRRNEFVPPVTIGAFKSEDGNQNLVLDGQQRLTSILLAYLGLFPDRENYKKAIETFANEDDELEDEGEFENVIEWTFATLIAKGKDRQTIHNAVAQGHYKPLNLGVDDAFLKSKFLGFSYLVPNISDKKVQQKYYSSVFRNINIQGRPLHAQESRKSFYFLDNAMTTFFDPQFVKGFSVRNAAKLGKLDFVRYLAMLSQYKKDGNTDNIAKGYKSRMEEYYEQYIYSVVGETSLPMFDDFTTLFPGSVYKYRFQRLEKAIAELEISTEFSSIIDIDMYFFGLIYWIIFEDKTIEASGKEPLRQSLDAKIEDFRADAPHAKSPAAFKYLKSRIEASVEVYQAYAND
jgi:hypothetical protein